MPWKSNVPDPIEARRRQLAEQERLLSERRQRITEELSGGSGAAKSAEPPVWRMEGDEEGPEHTTEPTPARKRHLARQRQRDRFLFFLFILLFLIVVGVLWWVASVHNLVPTNGT